MTYELKAEIPDIENYIRIRLEAGLSKKSEQAASIGLPNSLHGVVVYFEGAPIGIGRIIGDGGCFFEITDIAVIPAHQKQGVGVMIMEALVAWLHDNALSTAYISLVADHGTPQFYAKFGFTALEPPHSSGMYMRIT